MQVLGKRVLYLPAGSNVSSMYYAGVNAEQGSRNIKSVFQQSATFFLEPFDSRRQPYFVLLKKYYNV